MLESTWLFVGVVGVLSTLAAVATKDVAEASVASIIGFISWGVWTFGSLNVRVVGDAVTYTFSMPSVTLLGIALTLVPGYLALTASIELIGRSRRGETRPREF